MLCFALTAAWPSEAEADIASLTFPSQIFRPVGSTVSGAQADLRFILDASPDRYNVVATNLAGTQVSTTQIEKKTPLGTSGQFSIAVPLEEGANQFSIQVTSVVGTPTKRAGPTTPSLVREMKNTVARVTLDAINPYSRSTSASNVNLIFTVTGNASGYEVTAHNSFSATTVTTAMSRSGEGYIRVPLVSNSSNVFWVTARGVDPPYGFSDPVSSETLTLMHDSVSPTITSVAIVSPSVPTNDTVVSVQGQTEAFADVTVDNTAGELYHSQADLLGNFTVLGITLPLVPPGPSTTALRVFARDAAGNQSPVVTVSGTRTGADPRFNLLTISPRSGQQVTGATPVTIRGAVGDSTAPYTVHFFLRAGSGSYAREETLVNLGNGDVFEKDVVLSTLPSSTTSDVLYSLEAQIVSTGGLSNAQLIGEITLDASDPLPPGLSSRFDQRVYSLARLLTVEGTAERFSSIDFGPVGGMSFVRGRLARVDSTPVVDGGEFKQTLDLSLVPTGVYSIPVTTVATSGRTAPTSAREILLTRDLVAPRVTNLEINGTAEGGNRPIYLKAATAVTLRITTDKPMARAPDVFVTERGLDALKAVLTATQTGNQVFEYAYAVTPNTTVTSADDLTDGPVEVVVTGGADRAGNTLEPEARFSQAFFKDSLAPTVDRAQVTPIPGSTVASAPDPLVLTIVEHPWSYYPPSGVDIEATKVRVFGPIETDPQVERTGQTEVYSSQTVTFRFNSGQFVKEGTYRIQVEVQDKAGNSEIHTLTLGLDTTPISTRFLTSVSPPNMSSVNRTTMTTSPSGSDAVSVVFSPDILSELALEATTMSVSTLCPSNRPLGGTTETVTPNKVRFILDEKFRPVSSSDTNGMGRDDGYYGARIFIRDKAGNITPDVLTRFTYDTTPPFVLDGTLRSLGTQNTTTQAGFFPATDGIAGGPLRQIRAGLMDGVSVNGFTGSGINTSLTTGSRVSLTLVGSFPTTTLPIGSSTTNTVALTSVTRFESIEPPIYSPCFAGYRRASILLELCVDPVSLAPRGLTTGGTWDGVWEMAVTPVDNAGNVGDLVRSRFLYDSIPPVVTVDSVANDQFITSNSISLTGLTHDEAKPPKDYGLGVAKVLVRVEQASATGVTTTPTLIDWTAAVLPPNAPLTNAATPLRWSFVGVLPRYVGKGRIVIRAIDRAGNIKDLVRDVNLMTELLPAPRLRTPTDNSATASPLVTFTWSQVTGASKYRLSVTDPDGNKLVTETLPQNNSATVSLIDHPEGSYSWICQAVDTQGFAGQAPYASRFTLDLVRPTVVNLFTFDPVLVDAHQGSILKGQVRVGVRFSEHMDTLTPPTVRVRPANPLLAELELTQIQYEQNQWRGLICLTSDVPEPDINGLAAVTVEGAKDLAGNLVHPSTTYFEISVGPFFDVRAFSSLIDRREILFHFKALRQQDGEPMTLTAPPLARVTQLGGPATTLELRKVRDSVWAGPYSIDPTLPGTAVLEVNGTDLVGNATTRVIPFDIQTVVGRARAGLTLPSGLVSLAIPEGAVSSSQTLIFLPPSFSSISANATSASTGSGANSELVSVATLDTLLPVLDLAKSATVQIDLSKIATASGVNRSKLGLYRQVGTDLVYQASTLKGSKLVAEISGTGPLALLADVRPPSVSVPAADQAPTEPLRLSGYPPELELTAVDGGSGVDPASVTCSVDQVAWNGQYDMASSRATFAGSRILTPGSHEVRVAAADRSGNVTVRTYKALGPEPFQVTEFVPWPNPCRSFSRIRYRLSSSASTSRLLIYDTSGRLVADLDGSTVTGVNDVSWNLTNRSGSPVASGVYFVRLKVVSPLGEVVRRDAKVAVIR